MRASILCQGVPAGVLSHEGGVFRFTYLPEYLNNPRNPAISLTLPKRTLSYESPVLFPFFYGLLAEGESKALQCRLFKIEEHDHFTRLLKTCGTETIGAVTVREGA
jgi:HipA-like protein